MSLTITQISNLGYVGEDIVTHLDEIKTQMQNFNSNDFTTKDIKDLLFEDEQAFKEYVIETCSMIEDLLPKLVEDGTSRFI